MDLYNFINGLTKLSSVTNSFTYLMIYYYSFSSVFESVGFINLQVTSETCLIPFDIIRNAYYLDKVTKYLETVKAV